MDTNFDISDQEELKNRIKRNFTIAIIPARGGSKTIPKKNIKIIDGKPLIAYSIDHAQKSFQIDDIYTTSDDNRILSIANDFGSKIIKRPKEISKDSSSSEDAIIHALSTIIKETGYVPEITIMLQPTSPIRDIKNIDNAIKKVKSGSFNSSISAYSSHFLLWYKDQKNMGKWVSNYGKDRPMRQDLEQYYEDGSIYVFNTLMFLLSGNRIIEPIHLEKVDQINSYEIDTPTDWFILESLIKKQNKNN